MWWILAFTGGRALILVVLLRFLRVCVFLRKTRWWRLREDGIKVSPPSPHLGDASSITCGRVEVCFRWISPWWICSDMFVVCLRSCFRLDPFDLCHSSMMTVVVLVCWFYGASARR